MSILACILKKIKFPFLSHPQLTFLGIGLLSFTSCVYTFSNSRQLPLKNIHKIAVAMFSNDTIKPRIESICTASLRQKLAQSGKFILSNIDEADAVVTGTIGGYNHVPSTLTTLKDTAAINVAQESSIIENIGFLSNINIVSRQNGEVIYRHTFTTSAESLESTQSSIDYNQRVDVAITAVCDRLMGSFVDSLRLNIDW